MAETEDVSMIDDEQNVSDVENEQDVSVEGDEKNSRPKRSLSISSTDNTPAKRRRIGLKPTNTPDAEQKRKEREELKKQKEEEKLRKQEELKKQKEEERLKKQEEKAQAKKQLEEEKGTMREEEKIKKQKELEEAKKQKEEEKAKKKEEQEEAKKRREEEKAKKKEEQEELQRRREEEKAKKKEEQEELQRRVRREEEKRMKEQDKLQKKEAKESKEREKQHKEEVQKIQAKRQSALFINYFVKAEVEKPKFVGWSNALFMPFQVKQYMEVAPLLHGTPLSKDAYDNVLSTQLEKSDYLSSIHGNGPKRIDKDPLRAKYFHFHDNFRPPYYGTWRKRSKLINGRRPWALSHKDLNYEIDSDAEWEEERAEEADECVSEPDIEGNDEEDSADAEFYVDHGYLSENEGSEDSNADEEENSDERKRRLDHRAHEFKNQRNNKSRRMKKQLAVQTYGLSWDPEPDVHGVESRLLKAVIFNFPPQMIEEQK
ncbi:hypothetical protein M3Y97_01081700 [Aphelenchoides bicaudatus]|nr:hypothetical protein M3Y97_01081700 [Aphelenchoides bicaudatus]